MWYPITYGILALWVYIDAKQRMNNAIAWAIATFMFGVIVLPIYLAKRNLKEGEVREGGTGWNILKNFAIFWTLTMAIVAIEGIQNVSEVIQQTETEAEHIGATIGATLGLGMIFGLWFIVLLAALVLGLFLKTSVVEKGPTGPLAKVEKGNKEE